MEELYSNSNDCYDLNVLLMSKLKKRIAIYGSLSNPLINGKYYGLTENEYCGDYVTIKNGISFFAKYNKDGFLRIGVGDSHSRETTIGEKLAALSDICLALNDEYGTPDVFYTTKENKEHTLSLQWTFKNLEETHKMMKEDTYFDNNSIDQLIIIDNKRPIVNDEISEQIGLPLELYGLVVKNADDFVAYKNGTVKEEGYKYIKKYFK